MCGICGIIHEDPGRPVERRILDAMCARLIHRGPDDEGHFIGPGAGVAIRRLSIMDVEGGHQPSLSEGGEIASVCNGEIYNFRELKRSLTGSGHSFRSGSDAEVLPHLYEEEGASFVGRLEGMYGLAVWDGRERLLILARDRMGEKPLYWTHEDGMFAFASELKSLLAHPEVRPALDRLSLAKYLAHEYVPAPATIFEGIFKLEPGCLLAFKGGRVEVKRYWDIPIGEEIAIGEEEAARETQRLLERSVAQRLMSDVPLGAFLSGGIDSSSVVAMMARLKDPREIKTFSIAFEEPSFDESRHARAVAKFFGTDHHEELCTASRLIEILPRVASLLDEPLGDASIIPTLALAEFTKRHVKVALSGDGGDELFAGYPTFQAERLARAYSRLPVALRRRAIEPIARRLPVSDADMSLDFRIKQFIKGAAFDPPVRHIVWAGSFSPEELRRLLAFDVPEGIFDDSIRAALAAGGAAGNSLLYIYAKLYLAEDILTKVDRATMWASLESRAPFLDHRLVEFVARLPFRMKLRGFRMKHILKRAMAPLLPAGIASRPKKGFGIPVAKWIKGPLEGMFRDALGEGKLAREGLLRPKEVSRLLSDHIAGRADNRKKLWTLFVFEQWMERWGKSEGTRHGPS